MTTDDFRIYFERKKPFGAIVLLIFGILLFVIGLCVEGGFGQVIIGLAMSAGGIFLIVKNCKQMSDNAVDNFCIRQAAEYCSIKKAIVHSYGNKVTESIYSSGYCFENIFSARKAFKGKDNVWRSSIFEVSCVFFTENTVYFYSQKISLLTEETWEKQKEFNIQDIGVVSLEEINRSVVIAITIPADEKIYVNCKNKDEALELCKKIKSITSKSSV